MEQRLYLDVCTLCRPFDDQAAMRIRLETNAYYLILQSIRDQLWQMMVSPVHFQEVQAIPDPQERYEVLEVLESYGHPITPLETIRQRSEQLHSLGFGVADAAHVAFAESGADVFVSCDDRLLQKCQREHVAVAAMTPVAFCVREDLQ